MKIEIIFEGDYCSCKLPEHDIVFSIHKSKGFEGIEKRAKNIIEAKRIFELLYEK